MSQLQNCVRSLFHPFAVALLNLAGIRQCSILSLFALIFVCAVCALIIDHDIIIPDKEEC